jgi:hypothetical protein
LLLCTTVHPLRPDLVRDAAPLFLSETPTRPHPTTSSLASAGRWWSS